MKFHKTQLKTYITGHFLSHGNR